MKYVFDKILNLLTKNWWVEISTDTPKCVYYFGPFARKNDATNAEIGYVEDLTQEGAAVLKMSVIKCPTPAQLTVDYTHRG